MFKRICSLSAAIALTLALAGNSWAEQTWTVNFKDSDIQEVIKFVADVTKRTVVIDQRVKGRVKVISSKPLNEKELIDLFRAILEVHDYTVVDVNGVLRILPLKDARSSPVPVTDEDTKEEGFITQVIQLQNIAAAKVLPVIRPLVPQHSHLAAYDPANAIIISDTVENIDRIRELIERIDKSATPITEIIDLKYASAEDMVQTLTKLDKEDKNRSKQKSLQLIADKRNNAVLITGEDMQRKRIKQLIRRMDRPKPQTGNVRVIYLEYAKAKPTAEVLTKVVSNLSKLTPGGEKGGKGNTSATVEADEDTNALLITAEGDTLTTLLNVVERLDIRRAQVLVEAIIVELEEGKNKELGIDVMMEDADNGTIGSSNNTGGTAGVVTGAFTRATTFDPENPGSEASLAGLTALAGALAQTPGQILGVIGTNGAEDATFSVILKALDANSKTNILSTPSLLTMDNNEASFTVGKNIPIVTGSFTNTGTGTSSPFQTVQREDVGVILKVTPHVNEGDKVLMDIVQEISSVAEDATDDGLITNERKIETQVLSASGEIVVMGGFISEDVRVGERRVPVLGSIPILGRLFRSESKEKSKTNLMIFIRATVLRDDEALVGATAEKYEYIREQQLKQMNNGFLRLKNKDLPLLPDMSEYGLDLQPAVQPESEESESE